MLPQKRGGRQHVQEHAIEGNAAGQCQQHKACTGAQLHVAPHQVAHMKGLALLHMEGLWQQPEVGSPQGNAYQGQEPENAVPTRVDKQPATNDGCNRRSHPKVDGHLAHDLLGLCRGKHVADHRTRDHDACPRGQTLQRAEKDQLANRL